MSETIERAKSLGVPSDKSFMKPAQVDALFQDAEQYKGMLSAPPHVAKQVDRKLCNDNLRKTMNLIKEGAPPDVEPGKVDDLIDLEKQLREEFVNDRMPTQKEMRRNPAGAVDKHMHWENRNGRKVQAWKNVRRMLQNAGRLDGYDRESTDVANIEMFRPYDAPHELNMDNEQIVGKDFHFPNGAAPQSVTFTAFEEKLLQRFAPNVAGMLALLSADERHAVKQQLAEQVEQMKDDEPIITPEYIAGLTWTELQKVTKALCGSAEGKKDELERRLREFVGQPIPEID